MVKAVVRLARLGCMTGQVVWVWVHVIDPVVVYQEMLQSVTCSHVTPFMVSIDIHMVNLV